MIISPFNNASVPASAQATFPYLFAVSKYLKVPCAHGCIFALMDIGSSLHFQSTGMSGKNNMWVVEMISTLVRRLSPTPSGAALMSVALNILAKMLKWISVFVSELEKFGAL
ncbi:uncharacterized protein LOC133711487 [Rosa rugosa]|uniref:uncharacterized protein LOC133711487 n=1 Tax=Rosa rugosa TaxID=74645 RepID=UPI002B403378|nr:uncharacterized protein LOC133711487 [Rosa rugosa]